MLRRERFLDLFAAAPDLAIHDERKSFTIITIAPFYGYISVVGNVGILVHTSIDACYSV